MEKAVKHLSSDRSPSLQSTKASRNLVDWKKCKGECLVLPDRRKTLHVRTKRDVAQRERTPGKDRRLASKAEAL